MSGVDSNQYSYNIIVPVPRLPVIRAQVCEGTVVLWTLDGKPGAGPAVGQG